jgi:hypothetical protein
MAHAHDWDARTEHGEGRKTVLKAQTFRQRQQGRKPLRAVVVCSDTAARRVPQMGFRAPAKSYRSDMEQIR